MENVEFLDKVYKNLKKSAGGDRIYKTYNIICFAVEESGGNPCGYGRAKRDIVSTLAFNKVGKGSACRADSFLVLVRVSVGLLWGKNRMKNILLRKPVSAECTKAFRGR